MADKDVAGLTAATSIGASDLLYAVIGGNSRKITLANLFTSPTLVTPALGVATATSLAIGGATIGTNALAVTGTSLFTGNGTFTAQLYGPSVAVGPTGTPAYAFTSDATSGLYRNGTTGYLGFTQGTTKIIAWTTGTGLRLENSMPFGWCSSASPETTLDTNISRRTGGVIQAGTFAANQSGFFEALGYGAGGNSSTTAIIAIAAGTTAKSQINFASSAAPTSPADGDFWFDGTNVKIRVSGATKTFTLV